jgi:WSC domain
VFMQVRNTVTSGSPNLSVEIKTSRSCCVVPGLSIFNVTMAKTATIGAYVLYSGSYALASNQITTSKFSVSIDTFSDSFKSTALTGSCSALSGSDPVAYSYLGCYSDNVNSRTLPAATTSDNNMTLAECANFCSSYLYFGLEYTTQCFCGTSISSSSAEAAETDCNMPCGGDITETCGGSSILSVYTNDKYVIPGGATISGYQYLGCYNDTATARSLPGTYTYSSNMTVGSCATFCNGAIYFGVEYYNECYCGENLAADSTKQPVTDCSYPCSGNSSEFCGGSNRLDLYQLGSTIVTMSSTNTASSSSKSTTALSSSTAVLSTLTTDSPSSTTAPTSLSTISSTAASTSSTTTSITAPATGLPAGWAYQGCYVDNIDGVRSMLVQENDNPTMTIESCIIQCLQLGYTVAGMEYSDQCFCDDYVRNNASLASSDSQCAMTCAGNISEICGGPNLLSIYSNAIITILPPPTVQITNLPGSWVYKGCLQYVHTLSNSKSYHRKTTKAATL